jgi:signal transduction histidine kinase
VTHAPAYDLDGDRGYRAMVELAQLLGEGGLTRHTAERGLLIVARALDADGGELFLIEREERRPLARVGAGAGGLANVIAAPLLVGSRTVGGIELGAARERAFGPRARELLAAAASLLGPVVAGAAETPDEQQLLELRALQRVASAVSRSLDLDQVLSAALDSALEVAHAPAGSIYLYDRPRSRLTRVSSRGLTDVVAPPIIPVDDLRERYARGARIIDVDDPTETHELVPIARRHGIRRVIILPLNTDVDMVGLVALDFYAPMQFAPTTVATLEAIAGHNAVAIENARAHRLVALRARAAMVLRRFGERALAPPEQLDVNRLILETAIELTRTDRGLIARISGDHARVEHAVGKSVGLMGLVVPLSEPHLSDALKQQAPYVVEDTRVIATDSLFGRIVSEYHTGSFTLSVMRRRGEPIGLLLTASDERLHWEAEELEALQILGSTAAEVRERARVQAEARAERLRLDKMIEHLPMVVVVLGRDGTTLHMNAAGRAMSHEMSVHDLEHWQQAVRDVRLETPEGKVLENEEHPVFQAFAGITPAPREVVMISQDGHRRRAMIAVAAPLFDESGAVEAVVASLQDVSALRELADAKDRFLRVASHELRSPITSLRATVSLLEMDPSAISDERRRVTLLARVQRQVDRLVKLVEQLLDSARLGTREVALEIAECDLVALAAHAVELSPIVATGHHIVLDQEGPVPGRWDPLRIEQVLINLISNALRYSASGSSVTVRVRGGDERATVEVADDGIGIPADQLDRVFTPFFRAANATSLHKGGLGLGLHITAEIVRRHGGAIRVTSEVGRGSIFTVELPRGMMSNANKGDSP